jgi:glycosyltransferase involved in cell wall biosynthesis
MDIIYAIHQFYPDSFSGTERFLLQLASSIRRSGHHPRVLTYSLGDIQAARMVGELLVKEYDYHGIAVTAVRHKKVPIDVNTSLQAPSILSFAREYLGRNKCDLLHIAHPMRLAPVAAAAAELSIPYGVTLTDFWTICPKVNLRTSFDTLCVGPEGGARCARSCPELQSDFVKSRLECSRKLLAGAQYVVAPSRFLAAIFKRELPDLNVSIIPHGLRLGAFSSNRRTYDQTSRLIFAYCGGLAPHKGVHILLEAFRSLPSANVELRVYGATSEHQRDYECQLRDIAEKDERIRFYGRYDESEINEIFQSIDVVIIPSLCYESYSFTLHEALASNVPIIASDVGGLNEKVAEAGAGFTFRMEDQEDLASKLASIAADPAILNEIKRAMETVVLPLEEEEAYLYERIYQTAVSRRAAEVHGPGR